MADFKQSIKWMKEGKKVRSKRWNPSSYIHTEENLIKHSLTGNEGYKCFINDIETTDWEIYGEDRTNLCVKCSKSSSLKQFTLIHSSLSVRTPTCHLGPLASFLYLFLVIFSTLMFFSGILVLLLYPFNDLISSSI